MIRALAALLFFSSTMPLTISNIVVHYTSSDGVCTDACGYHDYSYTWCKQSGGNGKYWDYCSLEAGLEATGKRCATACDFWGASYRYCYLRNGNWHYCGLLDRREHVQYSENNNICINGCRATSGSSMLFQCNTVKGTERCSPFSDVTPTGLPCHHNYRCAKYGHSVYRCHTDDGEGLSNHCGRKSLPVCTWITHSSATETCTLPEFQKEGQVIFRREKRNYGYPFAKADFKNAVQLIDKIDFISSLPVSEHLAKGYLYKLESILCNGINYTNVELKIGCFNVTSVAVAHVLFPDNLSSAEILRLALYMSLHSSFYLPAYTIVVSVGEPMACSIKPVI